MLKLKHVTSHRKLFVILICVVAVFDLSLGGITYAAQQRITKIEADAKAHAAHVDKKIAEIKAKKEAERKAREEAERKAREDAKRKAAAEAALRKQLRGEIVTPAGCAISGAHGDPSQIDVVINKKHCFNPINYVPGDLVSYQGFLFSAKILPSLKAMFNAASKAGVPLSLTSSYRSYSDQVTTYNNWVRVNGSTAAADTVSARPGYSEHQTGFTMDLSAGGCSLECFAKSAQYKWMKKHAAEYGFIERYKSGYEDITGYSPEAWHWRYVGVTVAQDMKAKGVKTLEQYWGIEGGGY